MRLLTTSTFELVNFTCRAEDVPPYAILSHTWDEEEVEYSIFKNPDVEKRKGYSKIISACEQAQCDKLEFIWIDTCCIDKSSSSELSEAINSMFLWYRNAQVCYAYLSDVSQPPSRDVSWHTEKVNLPLKDFPGSFETSTYSQGFREATPDEFASSRWWTRGWTLQELLAPRVVVFYSQDWIEIGCKSKLIDRVALITGIDSQFLSGSLCLQRASVAKKMSWAAGRNTTRLEDQAYSLMGIFDVNMPLLYGEGEKAFIRLQEEIMKRFDDHSLFAWTNLEAAGDQLSGMLAPNPSCFKNSRNFVPFQHRTMTRVTSVATNQGVHLDMVVMSTPDQRRQSIGLLNCARAPDCDGFATIYLQRIARTAPHFARVRSNTLGWTAHWGTPQSVFVTPSHQNILRPSIWPNSILALRKGPTQDVLSAPLQDLVSIHYRLVPEIDTKMPFLARPANGQPAFELEPGFSFQSPGVTLDEEFLQWEQQARLWVSEGIPLFYTLPNEESLVSVAFELVLKSGIRLLVMIGSNSEEELGFDCKLLEKEDRRDLCERGRSFRSRPLNRFGPSRKVDLGPYTFEISIGVEFVESTKLVWVDIQVKSTTSPHQDTVHNVDCDSQGVGS